MVLRTLFLYLFCCLILTAFGQEKQGANWFFGGISPTDPGTHLDFSDPKALAVPFNYDFNNGAGVATISDRSGKLLFFSSQGHVATRAKVNNKYQQMPNGSVFGLANIGTRAELIMQSPQDEQVYYIFLLSNPYPFGLHDLYVAEVDMRLNNGLGDVAPNSLRLLKKNVAQGMAAMLHANNRDFWLLSANALGDSLRAYPVNAAGIGAPVVSLTNKNLTPRSWLKSAPNSELFVTSGKQGVELFHFNRQAGTAAALYTMAVPDSVKQQGFSYSFSPNSSKLYVGTQSRPGYYLCSILQYDLAAGNAQQIQQSATAIYYTTQGISGLQSIFVSDMQLAIDGKIYVSRLDSSHQYLSQISYPDQSGTASGFNLKSKYLGIIGLVNCLPALNQTLFRNAGKLQAQAIRDTICFGDSVQLSAYGAGAERFRWQLANGLTAPSDTLANPVVRPTATTTYRVIGSSPFRTDTAFVKVVVLAKSAIALTGATQVFTFAENQEYRVSGGATGGTLHWEISGGEIISGQGTGSIRVNWAGAGAGFVAVTETNRQGCAGNKVVLPVQVAGSPPPVFYNIITPNGDGRNETFTIENLKGYPQHQLMIFNRWGNQIYETQNYRNNWPEAGISAGTYYYLLKVKGTGQKFKGWLEVVK